MEDVLEVYHRPYDPLVPVVCMDETSKQLIEEVRDPIVVAPGRASRVDYEYRRNGVANLFLFAEPLAGRRHVRVTEQRTRRDWALTLKHVLDTQYPTATKVVLVMDNLNTHSIASLYEAFPPAEARRLAERLEIHHTPKHGSWLNVAEIELSVLGRQCLDRRIATKSEMEKAAAAWERERNRAAKLVVWQFTTADARVKLHRLYPEIRS